MLTVKFQRGDCIDDVDDVQLSTINMILPDRTVIIPNLKFTCDGWITNIKLGLNFMDSGSDFPSIQIWRPSPPSQLYSLVDKVLIQSSYLDTHLKYLQANFALTGTRQIHFLSGDVIGLYLPRTSGYGIRDIPATNDFVLHVFYQYQSNAAQIDFSTAKGGLHSRQRKPSLQFTIGKFNEIFLLCTIRISYTMVS